MQPLTFVVPMPPTLTNSGRGRSRHWRSLERERLAYYGTLTAIALCSAKGVALPWPYGDCRIPAAPTRPMARVTLSSHMTLGGAMDDTNAASRHKWLEDWLVENHYLASDRRTCVRWAAFPTQHVTRKEPARIELTITPRTDATLAAIRAALTTETT